MLKGVLDYLRSRKRVWHGKQLTRARPRLGVELLEDRSVPAVLNVGTAGSEYHTIQDAVNASQNGDLILVDPGTYQEQVTINKSIEIEGQTDCNGNSPTILAPAILAARTVGNPGAIVHVSGFSTCAEVEGFTIEGASGGQANLLYGVRVDGAAFAEVESNTIANIIDSSNSILGVGVSVGNGSDSIDGLGAQVGSADVNNNNIVNYQRAGVVVSNTGSSARVHDNVITATSTNPSDSVTGVEVSNSAVADVESNCISNNTNPNNAIQNGTGVLLFMPGQGTEIENNDLHGNDYGVFGSLVTANSTCEGQGVSVESNAIAHNTFVGIEFDNSTGVDISYNSLSHNGSANTADGGIYLFQSTNNLIAHNSSNSNDGSGIYVDAGSTGNLLQGNTMTGNDYTPSTTGNADAVDLSNGNQTGDTANTWINNTGNSSITNSGENILKHKPHHFGHDND
jgi:parallel beta-helix repeat protein